jgi:hypothetical protein
MKSDYRNTILSDIVGTEGIKTDVTVNIAPATIPILIGSVMVAVIAGILIAGAIGQMSFKK